MLMLVMVTYLLGALPVSTQVLYSCCAISDDDGLCISYYNTDVCTEDSCSSLCGGNWSIVTTTHSATCDGAFYGSPIQIGEVFAPEFLVAISAGLLPSHRRHALLSLHATGVLRTIPLVGPIVALLTPEYDENRNAAALEQISVLNRLVQDVAAGLADLSQVVSQMQLLMKESILIISDGMARMAEDQVSMRKALEEGTTISTRQAIQSMSGIAVARAEARMNVFLAKQMQIPVDVSTSGLAQKLMKLGMLCDDDPSLCLDTTKDYVKYYATTHTHGWGKVGVGCYSMTKMFSEITVERSLSALSYLAEGDNYFYRYNVKVIASGFGGSLTSQECCGGIQECAGTYVGECRNEPGCYAQNEPYMYGDIIHNRSSPFRDDGANFRDCAGAYAGEGRPECCASGYGEYCNSGPCAVVCSDVCNNTNTSMIRSCDIRAEVLGARLTTLWLPESTYVEGTRTLESIGGVSMELQHTLTRGGASLNIPLMPGMWPIAADFHDPFAVGKALFQPRNASLTQRMIDLLYSANGQDNTGMALPGPMIKMKVGVVPGSNGHVIMDADLISQSEQILIWATGGAPYSGWLRQDICTLNSTGYCCKKGARGAAISSIPFIKQEIESLLPQGYKPGDLYDSYARVNETVQYVSSFINNSYNTNLTASLQEHAMRLDTLRARSTELEEEANRTVAALKQQENIINGLVDALGSSGISGSDMLKTAAIWVGGIAAGIAILCILGILMRTGLFDGCCKSDLAGRKQAIPI